jgi:hypothetical protein
MRISDQTAAIKLAICDDIGERSYDFPDVAAILVQMLIRHPAVGLFSDKHDCCIPFELIVILHLLFYFVHVFSRLLMGLYRTGSEAFQRRYRIDVDSDCGKMYALIDPLSTILP